MAATALTRLADWVAGCPAVSGALAIERSRTAVLDTVACQIAGAAAPVTVCARRAVASYGAGSSSVVGGAPMAAPWAALVNGTAAHALDLDDYDFPAVSHPSAVLVPALLALGEEIGADGQRVLDAYVVGYECMARIGMAVNMVHYARGWHATATLGTLGAAAACARMLRLDAARSGAALSIATSMAAGFKAQFGTMAKPLHAGLAAKNGVLAARLAESGIGASEDTLDGPWSVLALLAGEGARGFGSCLEGLGQPLAIERFGLVVKRFPTCGYTHRAIAGLLELRVAHGLRAADVASIDLRVPDRNLAVLPFMNPRTEAEARFSLPYCLASALLDGDVVEAHFSSEGLGREAVRGLLSRVHVSGYPADPGGGDSSPAEPDHIRVRLIDGRVFEVSVGHVPGGPDWPLSEAELRAKLQHCCQGVLDEASAGDLERTLWGFDQLGDLREVTRHFAVVPG